MNEFRTLMTKKPLNFVLIGRSGSGKGTQAKFLMEHFDNLYYISTGDLFRDLAEQKTDVGKRVKKTLEIGGLPFDDLATMLWMHKISFNVKQEKGVLCDGLLRRLEEAKNLDRFFEFLERAENTKILLIDISREEAFNRLTKRRICKSCGMLVPFVEPYKNWEKCEKCGGELIQRSDDKLEAIKNRLDYFDKMVSEVIDYYKSQNKLVIINGEQPIEKVFKEILEKI